MYIHNPTTAIIYRFICLFVCAYGLFINITPISYSHLVHMLSYFTILTNFMCLFVFIKCILISTGSMLTNRITYYSDTLIFFKGMATMSVIVSCIAYDYVLNAKGVTYTSRGIIEIGSNDLFVHYLVPFLTLGDWLLFQPKGLYKWKYILSWMIAPLIYLAAIMLITNFTNDYPYFFLNIRENGISVFINILFLMTFLCIFASAFIISTDYVINRIFPTPHKNIKS